MRLDRVTITGADESVKPETLAAISDAYPFVEWGILVSENRGGRAPRFPGRAWIEQALTVLSGAHLSLHVCGRWVRELMVGRDTLLDRWGPLAGFQRVQLNFHGSRHDVEPAAAAALFHRMLEDRQLIFQMDGTPTNEALFWEFLRRGVSCAPLFDVSAGAGIVPDAWPRSFEGLPYHGYAGGLGPETIEHELTRIAKVAGDARIWIDMERRVRSADDQYLDVPKVLRVLELCSTVVQR